MTIELRSLTHKRASLKIETRADGSSHLTGYAAVFWDGTPETQFGLFAGCVERILPGAFDDALSRPDDVRCLFNHEPSDIYGRTLAGTLTLSVDAVGLFYDCELPASATLAESIDRGDVSGSSFGFNLWDGYGRSSWVVDKTADGVPIDVRQIESVTLFDVGPATFPAYAATSCELAQRSYVAWQRQTRSRSRLQRAQLQLARATSRIQP